MNMSTYDHQSYTFVLYIKACTQGIYSDLHEDIDVNSHRPCTWFFNDKVISFTWDTPQVT